ncbi:MAG: L-seryl-tRNA(Sec) selenium transferase [Phycisphaerales bacterium]|nr:L-seryl-tRNA(Sec) selenium transferase [Phycisphaerales bacterium]
MAKSDNITAKSKELLRALPSVDRLLGGERVRALLEQHPRALVVSALQAATDNARARILAGDPHTLDADALLARAEEIVTQRAAPSLRRVLNATGVVLHTGLGRAPLSADAIAAIVACASGYSNLELDLAGGTRGRRADHVAQLLAELTGAEAATVVNNNAAATLLILNTIARSGEVVVSRGELVEIGGSYRLPEMMAASGAVLREVGTTNRTRIADYERAIGENTAALMRVHTSNFRVVGFAENVGIAELAELGRRKNLPVIDDLGSGALHDLTDVGLPAEPAVRDSIAAGADLACFSGDKLLGGPQAGIIVGRRELVRRIEANPLMRTYRTDKMTLAALQATLQQHRDPASAAKNIPTLAMLRTDVATLAARAQELAKRLGETLPEESFDVIEDGSVAGGGSMPARELATRCVAWQPKSGSVSEVLEKLRQAVPPVIARAKANRILFDVRTLTDDEAAELVTTVGSAVRTTRNNNA